MASREAERYIGRVRKLAGRWWCAAACACAALAITLGGVEPASSEAASPPAPQGSPSANPDEVVIRIGDRTVTVGELESALGHQPPGVLERLRSDAHALRYFAIQWFHRMLFAEAARADGFLARNPGLAEAAADLARRPIADAYVADAEKKYTATDDEIEQLYKMHPEPCRRPTRYRIARVGVLLGRFSSPEQEQAASKRMEAIAQRLANGEDFAAVVATSNDMPEKLPGGELGWVSEKDLVGEFGADTFRELPVGGTTGILRTPRGLEIFKLLEKEEERTLTLEECRSQLVEALEEQYYAAVRTRLADELVERLKASMNLDAFMAAARQAKPLATPTPRPGRAERAGGP